LAFTGATSVPLRTNHTNTSSQPFGIMVYGHASYTSYMYPGGLDLNIINIVN
jgi:hypothetical protein